MSGKIKYMMTILLFCESYYGNFIEKCFGLNKITDFEGFENYKFNSRINTFQVDISCDNSFIHLRRMIYSITKHYEKLCLPSACRHHEFTKHSTCDCCKVRPQKEDDCNVTFPFIDQEKQYCESKKQCGISVGIVDLASYCESQLYYVCDTEMCKSRWVDVEYDCVPGRTMKYLLLGITLKELAFTV